MEAQIGGETHTHRFYGVGEPQFNGVGKKSLEWDLNDWKWDGDLFVATPLNIVPSDCRNKQLFPVPVIELSNNSSSFSDETDLRINGKGKGALEKRQRDVMVVGEDELEDEDGSLALKLGGHDYPITEADLACWYEKNGKRSKVQGGNSNRAMCQVEGCGSDLSGAKGYHRRHKVCEMHAKASRALVGNVMQRFCQQCSRFHLLQEFDEGKRSCRRRLAGHNRRRRKTHPDAVGNGNSVTDDQASGYLLISLLRILSNLQSNNSDQPKDQDLLVHLLRSLAKLAGSFDAMNLPGLLQASQDLQKIGSSNGTSSEAAHVLISNGVTAQESPRPLCSPSKVVCETQDSCVKSIDQSVSVAVNGVEMPQKRNISGMSLGDNLRVPSQISTSLGPIQDGVASKAGDLRMVQRVLPLESAVERVRFRSFDLNAIYNDRQDNIDGSEKPVSPENLQLGSLTCPVWALQDCHQTSPPQTSGNSDSVSAQSLSSSNGDAQSRTDRMVFKLFGKDPSDFPLVLRDQIHNWLSNSPTDIEGYIRPGCIVLTIYLRLPKSTWEELCYNLSSSLKRLLDVTGDDFWRTGWVYARVQHQIAFVCNGQVVLDAPLLLNSHNHCKISSVTPIAVSVSRKVTFTVKGFNLARSTARLLCAFEGRYLAQEATQTLVDGTGIANDLDGSQCLHISCSLPNATGRGFIEIEDHGLSGGFFPFIVAEEDVSSEICMLESSINVVFSDANHYDTTPEMKARNRALDFLHEMGWLLRRSYLKSRSENSCSNVFPLMRFKSLMEFSMDHNWCAVVKKLLDILFGGAVDVGERTVELALSEMALLHSAVQKSCRPIVELLLRYVPHGASDNTRSRNTEVELCPKSYIFRPDMLGPFDVTPLHIAASRDGAESVLDALTDDPGLVGIKAWKSARDSTGFTPEDYASSRGYESYIHLVQKKLDQNSGGGHMAVDILGISLDLDITPKQTDRLSSSRTAGFQIDRRGVTPPMQPCCRLCTRQVAYGVGRRRTLKYRPTMLFMVGIAGVCVCVGLLLKSPPEVFSLLVPFRWELLEYGVM